MPRRALSMPARGDLAGLFACLALAAVLPVQMANDALATAVFVALAALALISAASGLRALGRAGGWPVEATWIFAAIVLLRASVSPAAFPAWSVATRSVAVVGAALALAVAARRKRRWEEGVAWILLFATLAVAGDALLESLGPGKARAWWADARMDAALPSRVGGLFANPNLLGAWAAVLAWFLVGKALRPDETGKTRLRWPFALGAVAALQPLLLSQSRGAWGAALLGGLAFAAGGALVRAWRGASTRRVLVAMALGAALTGLPRVPTVLGRGAGTLATGELGKGQRKALLRGIVRHAWAHMPFGSGVGSFSTVFPRHRLLGGQYPLEAHGDLAQWTCEGGIFLAAAFAAVAVGAAASQLRAAPGRGPGLAALVTLAASSFFVAWSAYVALATTAWFLLALTWSASAKGEPEPTGTAWAELLPVGVGVFAVLFWIGVHRSDLALERARASMAAGRRAEAERALDVAACWMPPRAEIAGLRARLRVAAGDLAGGRSWLERARRLDPEESIWIRERADLAARAGDRDEARRLYERALSMDPHSELLLTRLARLALAAGELDEAEGLLRRALATNPAFLAINRETYPAAEALLEEVLRRRGRVDEADAPRARRAQ